MNPYLLIKADAAKLPLRDNSVGMVIATPPLLGVRHRPRTDYCTTDAVEYERYISRFVNEALRVVQPRAHILMIAGRLLHGEANCGRPLVFHLLRKRAAGCQRMRSEKFVTHFVGVKGFPWWAIPVRIYRDLIRRYSKEGDVIAHVFSGSGNGALAALQLNRVPILIDLHYHREVGRRMLKLTGAVGAKRVFT